MEFLFEGRGGREGGGEGREEGGGRGREGEEEEEAGRSRRGGGEGEGGEQRGLQTASGGSPKGPSIPHLHWVLLVSCLTHWGHDTDLGDPTKT